MKRLLLLLLGLLLATAPYLQAQDDNPDATSEVALVGIAPNEGKYYLFDAANEVIQEDTLMGDELSRFLSVDPLRHAYPMLTPYQFASNTPIVAIDLDGLEALKASDYATLEELKTELKIQYYSDERTELVTVSHTYGGVTVTNQLEEQVTEKELAEAMQGSGWDRFVLGVQHPYLAWTPLEEALTLSMRGANETGVAFWDIAINMYSNISSKDKKNFSKADKNAKIGYMNTFLHVIGQAFLTTLFSKGSADRLGDIHENSEPREMRTGVITTEDLRDKAINTYVDLANNSWGQVLGAGLREKYGITKETTWTPQLTANYLNDIQKNMSDTHCIQFKPFKPYQNVILKFTRVLNSINTDEKDEKKVSNLFAFIICIFISCYNYKVEEKCCSIQNYKIVERNKEPFCTGSRVLHFNTISEEILKKYDGEIIQDITYYPGQYEKKCSLDKVYLADFFIDIQSDTINIIERFDFCENYLIEYYISLKIDDPEIELQHFKNRIKEEIGCKTFDTLKVNERLIRTYDNVIIEMYLSEVHYTPGEQRGFELEVIYKIQPVN